MAERPEIRVAASPASAPPLDEPVASPVLRRAVRVVLAQLPPAADPVGDIRQRVLRCARAVESRSDPLDGAAASPAERELLRQLLDRLYSAAVQGWRESPPQTPAEMLHVLDCFEHVRGHLTGNGAGGPGAHLAAPTGVEFAMELAHDLRSPLTSILFLSETLRGGQMGDINDVQRRQLGIIYSAALHLVSMASDVIEWAKGGEQIVDRAPSVFSLREMLDSIRSLVAPMAEEKSLAIRIQSPDDDQRLGHPVPLSRVLLNLTANALKFTEEGYVEIAVTPTGTGEVEFSVRDTGRGIDPAELPHLFEPFHRSTSGKRYDFSSSGLGLAICRKLVNALGTELRYETSPGRGSRFYFRLSLAPAPEDARA